MMPMRMQRYADKVAIVTGAAGGIGLATAHGASIVVDGGRLCGL